MENRVIIETPESISFTYNVAGIGSRFIALLFDTTIQILIYVALFALISYLDLDSDRLGLARGWLVAIVIFIFFVLFVFYFALFESVTGGQTLGKRITHLRVVREDGQPLQVIDSVVRNLVRLIDFFPGLYSLGVVTMLLNDRSKRLGDYAAGTIVIKEGGAIKLSDLTNSPMIVLAVPGLEDLFEQAARRVGERDIAAAESLLRRWEQLGNAESLAEKLTAALGEKARLDALDEDRLGEMRPRAFLIQLASAYRRLNRGA